MTEWYYTLEGTRKGPVAKEEIQNLIESKKIDNDTKLWKEGMENWLTLKETEFKLPSTTPPPIDGDNIKQSPVWLLAFSPLIGLFIEYIIASQEYGATVYAERAVANGEYMYVTIGLYIALSLYDSIQLHKAGYDTKKFSWWIIFIPVYLYQRSKYTKTSKSYFWTWLGCAVLVFLYTMYYAV